MHGIMRGLVAGAVGTVALDTATYADMALRGRGSSGTPAALVGALADRLGLASLGSAVKDEATTNRRRGIGALLGYATGVGVGLLFGAVQGRRETGGPLTGIVVGLAAMAASDVPIAALGVSDPRTWSLSDWASDVIPHLIYGVATVAAYMALDE